MKFANINIKMNINKSRSHIYVSRHILISLACSIHPQRPRGCFVSPHMKYRSDTCELRDLTSNHSKWCRKDFRKYLFYMRIDKKTDSKSSKTLLGFPEGRCKSSIQEVAALLL